MNEEQIKSYLLDAFPFSIVFVDLEHKIRYMNKRAKYHYHEERGYDNLIGKSIFDCHNQQSKKRILETIERLKAHGNEEFLKVTGRNERLYITPVRNENGALVGYFERFEMNLQM